MVFQTQETELTKWFPLGFSFFLYFPEKWKLCWLETQVRCYCNELHGVFSIFAVGEFYCNECSVWNPIPNLRLLQTLPQKMKVQGSHRPSRSKEVLGCISPLLLGRTPFSFYSVHAVLFNLKIWGVNICPVAVGLRDQEGILEGSCHLPVGEEFLPNKWIIY